MGAPENPREYVRLDAHDLAIYVSREIWDSLKPGQSKLLVAVSSFGRFWVHLVPAPRHLSRQ
jgi:hypothetical protein